MDLRRQEAAGVHLSSRFPLQVRSSKFPWSRAWSNTVQRGAGSVELRHPSSIEATLYSPKTFQQLGSLFCARLRDNSRLLDHLQPWLSYGASTSSTLATLVSWSHGKVLFIQLCAVGEIFLISNFFSPGGCLALPFPWCSSATRSWGRPSPGWSMVIIVLWTSLSTTLDYIGQSIS